MRDNIATEYVYATFELLGAIIITPFIPVIAVWVCWELPTSAFNEECIRGFKIIWGVEDYETQSSSEVCKTCKQTRSTPRQNKV